MLKSILRKKTVVIIALLAIAAFNCTAIEVNFTGSVLAPDGNYVAYITQNIFLYASVTNIVVNGAVSGEYTDQPIMEYRWYINDVLQQELVTPSITLSSGMECIDGPATCSVKVRSSNRTSWRGGKLDFRLA